MKYDQVYYTSSTIGIRGGAGFQINAHSGNLEPDITRELEAYSLYTPPTECPRTPETPEELALFPISYRYRLFGGRLAGLSRSIYLGRDYNSVRYGNFFTHTIFAPGKLDHTQLLDPLQMAKMGIWTKEASETTEIPSLELKTDADIESQDTFLTAWQHPHFIDLISFALAGLTDKKTTVIVDNKHLPDLWISALLNVLPAKIRTKLSFSTYEFNPQNLDYNICGTRHDTGFDFSEASFKFNFYILDFEQDRFSDSLEHGHFARNVARLASNDPQTGLASLLAIVDDILTEPDLSQLDSIAELWYIVHEDITNTSIVKALMLMKDFNYVPTDEMLTKLQKGLASLSPMGAAELQNLWLYLHDSFILSSKDKQDRLNWAYGLLITMIKAYPYSETDKISILTKIIQESGGLLQLDSYDLLVDELQQKLMQTELKLMPLLQLTKELFLMDHPQLQTHLKRSLMEQLGSFMEDSGLGFITTSLAEQIGFVEDALLESLEQKTHNAHLINFWGKLLIRKETNSLLMELIGKNSKNELKDILEVYELFGISNWEEAAQSWWDSKRDSDLEAHLHATFWNTAHILHPNWAPLHILEIDLQLIEYPSFHNAFWRMISSYNISHSYDQYTRKLLNNLESWINIQKGNRTLTKETQNIGYFISAFKQICFEPHSEIQEPTRQVLTRIPPAYEEYKHNLVVQLIEKLMSRQLRVSDWERLLFILHKAAPMALSTCIDRKIRFSPNFWAALLSFVSTHNHLIPEDLKESIKERINDQAESELQNISKILANKPDLVEYLKNIRKKSIFSTILDLIKSILKR